MRGGAMTAHCERPLTCPAFPQRTRWGNEPSCREKSAMTDRPTILVVEDDPDIRELLAELLEDEGYDVHIAADGEAAIDELEHWEPSVMLLDLMLPRISGWEILRRMRTGDIGHPPNAIIVLSASGAAAN